MGDHRLSSSGVAREHGIPAVLGIPQSTTRILDGSWISVNGTEGTVRLAT
ncbi:PEP-utilizing enzyme [Gulosibacter chungangensis]